MYKLHQIIRTGFYVFNHEIRQKQIKSDNQIVGQ
jgi:hypothetical protein